MVKDERNFSHADETSQIKKEEQALEGALQVRARTGLKAVKAVALIGRSGARVRGWKGYNTLITTQYLSVIAERERLRRDTQEEIAGLSGIKRAEHTLL